MSRILLMLLGTLVCSTSCQMLTEEQYNVAKFGTTYNPDDPVSFQVTYTHSACDDFGRIYLADSNVLKLLELSSRATISIHHFTQPISAMTYKDNVIYLSEGSNYWSYNTISSSLLELGTTEESIYNLAVVGDYLLVNDFSGAWTSYTLVRLSDNAVVDKKEWKNGSKSFVYSASRGRIFHLRDGTVPNDICYEDINTIDGKFGASGDSPYHGDYSLGHPLVVFPDESRIIAGTGYLFEVGTLLISGNIGVGCSDVGFSNGYMFVVASNNQLRKYRANSSLDYINIVKSYTGIVKRIYIRGAKIIVLYQVGQKLTIDILDNI